MKLYQLNLDHVNVYSKYNNNKIYFEYFLFTVSKIPTCRPSTAVILITALKLS